MIPIYEAGEAENTLFIAMRYVEGTDLRELLQREGRLEPERTIALLSQVADALDEAHDRGLIHRDVKPGNILVGGNDHVYLGDFGLTRRAEDPDAGPSAGNSLGTVDYVAPEQIEGGPVDARTDVYSLGCVLYHCLTGQPPYQGSSPMGVLWDHLQADPPTTHTGQTNLPEAIDRVIAQALAKHPDERQPTCHELVDQARGALGLTKEPRRRLLLALTALAFAIVTALVTGLILLTRSDSSAPATHRGPTRAVTAASVQHIDPATNALVSTARVDGEITQVAAGEGGIWATDDYGGVLIRISPGTGSVTGRTFTSGDNIAGGNATGVATGLGSVWVLNAASSTLSEVDPGTLGTVAFGGLIHRGEGYGKSLAVGRKVWVVASQLCGTPSCVPDTELRWFARDGSHGSAIFPPLFVTSMAASNGTLWLAGHTDVTSGSGSLDAVDEASRRFLSSTRLDFLPGGGLAAGTGDLWLSAPTEDQLVRIDAGTRKITKRIPVGRGPIGVAFGAGAVWVANYEDGTVSRVDPETNTVAATIEVGPHPDHIATGEGGVWVAVDPL